MKPIVVDASAAAAWVLPDELSDGALQLYAQACVDEDLFFAPPIWRWETGNLLIMAVVRKRIALTAVDEALNLLYSAQITIEPSPSVQTSSQVARLAGAHNLTFYDASYLELALRLNGHLASKDKALVKAAKSCGIVCLDF